MSENVDSGTNCQPLSHFVHTIFQQIYDNAERKGRHLVLPSGYIELDRLTEGFCPGTLTIIAARPAMGKTAFGLSVARNMTVDFEKTMAFFSLELTSKELVMRLINAESRVDGCTLEKGNLAPYDMFHLEKSMLALSKAKLFLDDTPQLSIDELCFKCRNLKQQHNIQMVIIDYLQLLCDEKVRDDDRYCVNNRVCRQLKALAIELNIPVLVLSQLKRSVEVREGDMRPELEDLDLSLSVLQNCVDTVLLLYRPEYYGITNDYNGPTSGMAYIILAMHPSNNTGEVRLKFLSQFARFENIRQNKDFLED